MPIKKESEADQLKREKIRNAKSMMQHQARPSVKINLNWVKSLKYPSMSKNKRILKTQ